MNDADDNLDQTIEVSLRQAHQQVQCRPEWAAHVLSQVSQELAENRSVDSTLVTLQSVSPSPKRSWSKVTAMATGLAAGLLLAAVGSVFLARSMNRKELDDAANSVANNPPSGLPTDTAPQDASPSNALTEPQLAKSGELTSDAVEYGDSVTAGTGYLATKLSSEAEFEIYVVLPTMPINVAGNTK